ncbi:MAG TPA: hypothetical protein VJT31_13565, partial [Rugosimonospora sp.]|nr:hypothetical protein [Rugosimonospora sp.]
MRWPEVRQVAGRILRYARHPVLSALLPRGWRYRFTRWQARRVLAMARRTYREYQELMVGVPGLDGATAARLRPALRAFAVQDAAFERSPWWWGYAALRLLTALACVVLPAAVLADRFLAHGTAARV